MNANNQPVSPLFTLKVLLLIGAGCAVLMLAIPEEGIALWGDTRLSFSRFENFLQPVEKEGIVDAADFLDQYTPLLNETTDSTNDSGIDRSIDPSLLTQGGFPPDADSAALAQLSLAKERMRIQSGTNGFKHLSRFFERARSLPKSGGKLRVLHYGDSQIETDRITNYLRNELQKRFGGAGAGWVPAVEVVPTGAVKQSASANWKRYTIYGKLDTSITHSRYAPLGTFATYDSSEAELRFRKSGMAYGRAANFEQVKLLYGNYTREAKLSVFVGDSLFSSHRLPVDSAQRTLTWALSSNSGELRFVFDGGPVECYAVGFEGNSGIQVDNIGMRGSSGTIFRKMDRGQLGRRLREDPVGMVILQYGGNTVPYVKDSVAAENYGRWIQSQIRLFQELLPETPILLIGPSDMAHKVGDAFVTYPMLETVRDELKKAAFETGCGYWDLYEVMGGRNSMEAWVTADPPLAGTDYVHFTPKGALRVAELLVRALFDAEKNTDELP
ncbi:MAG: GDSL-type esterase/lipase family protein [Flavobacteriales bacterium]